MRHFLTISLLMLLSLTCFGQSQNVDALISKINNQQIIIMQQYVWYPKMFSSAGDSLIKMGKPATDKLISLLSDTAKGIIAHFVLSNIWSDKLEKAGQMLSGSVHQVDDGTTAILGVLYTDFTFYQDSSRRNFARQADLDKNKKRWLSFLATNNFRQK